MTLNPWELDRYSEDIVDQYIEMEQKVINHIIDSFTQNANNDDLSDNSSDIVNYVEGLIKYSRELKNHVHGNIIRAEEDNIKPISEWFRRQNGYLVSSLGRSRDKRLKETDKYMRLVNRNMARNSANIARQILTSATNEFRLGNKTKVQAVSKALHQWADNGIPALIDDAGKRWSPETYVRTVVQSQANKLANEETLARVIDNGKYVDISAHVGARPLCAPYQGKRYSMFDNDPRYPSFYSTSYGKAAGILGINCHHHLLPVANNGDVYHPANINDKDNERMYKYTQKQREYERDIRKTKRHIRISKNADDGMLDHYQRKLRHQQVCLRSLTNNTGLRRQRDREKNII
jgi:Phage minor capsid protein 2.